MANMAEAFCMEPTSNKYFLALDGEGIYKRGIS
jgi:hypothetical protein